MRPLWHNSASEIFDQLRHVAPDSRSLAYAVHIVTRTLVETERPTLENVSKTAAILFNCFSKRIALRRLQVPSAASIAEYRAKVEALYKVHNPTKMVREPMPPPPRQA